MKRRRFTAFFVMFLLVAVTAVATAEMTVTRTPLKGSLTPLNFQLDNSRVDGMGYKFDANGGPETPPGNIYDNIPSVFGGLATGPSAGFFDWTPAFQASAWGDDTHGNNVGVINTIHYIYLNTTTTGAMGTAPGPVQHTIWVGNQSIPSATHGAPGVKTFPGLASFVVSVGGSPASFPSAPSAFLVKVGNLSIPSTGNHWVGLRDAPFGGSAATGADRNFWLVGQNPGKGFSHSGNIAMYSPASGYYLGGGVIAGYPTNTGLALSGVPEPATIGLLALAGMLVLGWRRRA